jgi:hypothetical protein
VKGSFAQLQTEDRRLVLLRLLSESGGYRANLFLLQTACAGFGHDVSQDRLQADVDWLEEQGLLKTEGVGGVCIATLTQRGLDVAQGRAHCTGVKRPMPGE